MVVSRKIKAKIKIVIVDFLINNIRYFKFIKQIQNPTQPITFEMWFDQKIRGINSHVDWPVHRTSRINCTNNIFIGTGSFPGYMPGSYIQGLGKIKIGKGCIFGPNIGIISSNHDIYDNSKHVQGEIVIGDFCWMGMGSIILPNVVLGDFTIVAAGAIVTKSFAEGYCVIGGNPARIVKYLCREKCHGFSLNSEFVGFSRIK
jgi:acetyltransferase-like isoleucine patch superfamily enzyme